MNLELATRNRRRFGCSALVVSWLMLTFAAAAAQGLTIDWWTLDGGVGTSTGGAYAVTGIIGQSGLQSMSGGTFVLSGGISGGGAFTLTTNTAPSSIAMPIITPPGGTFTNSQKVTLCCTNKSAKIRYTLTGADPNSSSTVYKTTGIILTNSVTLRAEAFNGTNASAMAMAKFTIIVPPPPIIVPTSLLVATEKKPYTAPALAVTPGTGYGAFKWSLAKGSKLPAGLKLNARTGIISGKPTKTGTFNFTVEVTDARKKTGTQALSLTVD